MIELINLTRYFGSQMAVDHLSFCVQPGEVVGFLGPNGAGKSTTMKMLTGFLEPSSGTARVMGYDIVRQTRAAQRCLGYLAEGAPCYSDMTVRGFLSFIAEIRGYRGRLCQQRLDEVSSRLELDSVLEQRIETLSKGFRRRVGLAQAILHDPQILILDEPTDGLDPNQKHQVRQLIRSLSKEKMVIISTHILEEVTAVCSRALVINQGALVIDATPLVLESRSRYHQAVTLMADHPLDESALQALPGVLAVEANPLEGSLTVLAHPGRVIYPQVAALIAERGWSVRELEVERGRLEDVFRHLTQGETP